MTLRLCASAYFDLCYILKNCMRRVLPQLFLFDWLSPKRKCPQRAALNSTTREELSDPGLKLLWESVREKYFPHRPDLCAYSVYWSRRSQKRVLASCNVRAKKISVARELKDPLFNEWLDPLLYHEMCHAYLGEDVPRSGKKRLWHGSLFKDLEDRHPKINALDSWIKEGGWLYAVRRDRGRRSR